MRWPRPKFSAMVRACWVLSLAAVFLLCGCQSKNDQQSAQVPAVAGSAPDTGAAAAGHTASRSPNAMPDFVLQDLTGREVHLSDYAGKAVLINFWATWCPPCKAELPDLVEIQRTHGGDRFTVIGVSLDQTGVEGVQQFVNEKGLNFPILMGNEDVVIQYGNFRGIPTSFLLNANHELARKYSGLVTRQMVESDLSHLLDEQA